MGSGNLGSKVVGNGIPKGVLTWGNIAYYFVREKILRGGTTEKGMCSSDPLSPPPPPPPPQKKKKKEVNGFFCNFREQTAEGLFTINTNQNRD